MTEQAAAPSNDINIICEALTEATGLRWNPPPSAPSFLKNGYFTETEMLTAPLIVRQLKEIAMDATGRPRAIIFERSSKEKAAINIPKEIAENKKFIDQLTTRRISAPVRPSTIPPVRSLPLSSLNALPPRSAVAVPASPSDN